jgi:hypothetical protein
MTNRIYDDTCRSCKKYYDKCRKYFKKQLQSAKKEDSFAQATSDAYITAIGISIFHLLKVH